jgi:hypothetical protein
VDAYATFTALEECSVVASALLTGSAEANREALSVIDSLTGTCDLWLLMNPCPDDAIRTIGQLVAVLDGVRGAEDGTLAAHIGVTSKMVLETRSIALWLAKSHDRRSGIR